MMQKCFLLRLQEGKKSKGFSLIEIMIVVAILGILATIAVALFQQQRTNAYNSSALSIIGNIAKHEESLFLETSEYGTTHISSTAQAKGKGDLITGGSTAGYLVTSQNSSSNPEFRTFGVSEGVSVVVASDSNFQTFVITSKHVMGDQRYCFDSDTNIIYYDYKYAAGTALTRSTALSAQQGSDECANANMTKQ